MTQNFTDRDNEQAAKQLKSLSEELDMTFNTIDLGGQASFVLLRLRMK